MATALVEPQDVLAELETNPGIRRLRELARELGGITGYSSMTKEVLTQEVRRTVEARLQNQDTHRRLVGLINGQFDARLGEFRQTLRELVDRADQLASEKVMQALQKVLARAGTLTDEDVKALPELLSRADIVLVRLQEETQAARSLIKELNSLLDEAKVVVEERRMEPSRGPICPTVWHRVCSEAVGFIHGLSGGKLHGHW